MKKNAMLKIAAILMVAVLLTTCAISSTFAKYVTSATSSDEARVAKFGVTVTTNIADLFKSKYDASEDEVIGIASVADDGTITYADVVAPGTSGGITTASVVTGQPEVAVEIKTEATVNLGTNWVGKAGGYYCPLAVTVNGTTLYGNDFDTAALFAAEIKKEIEKANNVKLAPNSNLATHTVGEGDEAVEVSYDVAISWEWKFVADTANLAQQNDVDDTFLGDQAAAGSAGSISITLTQSVTQLDNYTAG